jgi:hypothetical protein
MGLFRSNHVKPSKPGTYQFAWPVASGLGMGLYPEESEARTNYLIYSSERRVKEGWASEDVNALNETISILSPLNYDIGFPVVTGPVDLHLLNEVGGSEFSGQALITDRATIIWWVGHKGHLGQYAILRHPDLKPKVEDAFGYHFWWRDGGLGILPVPGVEIYSSLGFSVKPHFSNDGHANRRGASVQATLQRIRGDK